MKKTNATSHIDQAMEQSGFEIFKRVLVENYRQNRMVYPLAAICLIIVGGTSGLLAWLVRDIVNDVLLADTSNYVFIVAATFVGAYILRGFAGYFSKILMAKIGNSLVATYQAKTYRHLMTLGMDFFSEYRSGQLVGQINQNIGFMRVMIVQVLSALTRDTATIIGLLVVMLQLEPVLSLVTAVVAITAALATRVLVKKMKRKSVAYTQAVARVSSRFQDTVQNIGIVKSFTLEEKFAQEAQVEIELAQKRANSTERTNAATKPIMDTLAGLSIGALLSFVGLRAASGNVDPGSFFAFLTAMIMIYEPIKRLLEFRVKFEAAVTNARMLESILQVEPSEKQADNALSLAITDAKLSFKDVSFSYDGDNPTLKGINFEAQPRKTTALVGPSGGGKSSIINLILRLYDVDAGTIEIDGQNISDVTLHSLRDSIALVSQAPVLFEGSIAQNIQFGSNSPKTREEIIEAAKAAFAHDFIEALPFGYDTPVGELGSNFSGGQKQRLSIARAILRDAPILLLDEATSALDNESEAKVQEAIDKLAGDRTTIIVAHRLSTIAKADQILVVDNGEIVESGDQKTLLKSGGVFAQLHALQDRNK